MGRQSLTIQPQPESRFLREYRMKQQRKTMGNIFEDNLSRTSSNSTSNGTGNFIPDVSNRVIWSLDLYFNHYLQARSSKHSYDDSIIKKTNDLDTVSRRGSFQQLTSLPNSAFIFLFSYSVCIIWLCNKLTVIILPYVHSYLTIFVVSTLYYVYFCVILSC